MILGIKIDAARLDCFNIEAAFTHVIRCQNIRDRFSIFSEIYQSDNSIFKGVVYHICFECASIILVLNYDLAAQGICTSHIVFRKSQDAAVAPTAEIAMHGKATLRNGIPCNRIATGRNDKVVTVKLDCLNKICDGAVSHIERWAVKQNAIAYTGTGDHAVFNSE